MASGGRNWKGLVLEGMKEMVVQRRQHAQGPGACCKAVTASLDFRTTLPL